MFFVKYKGGAFKIGIIDSTQTCFSWWSHSREEKHRQSIFVEHYLNQECVKAVSLDISCILVFAAVEVLQSMNETDTSEWSCFPFKQPWVFVTSPVSSCAVLKEHRRMVGGQHHGCQACEAGSYHGSWAQDGVFWSFSVLYDLLVQEQPFSPRDPQGFVWFCSFIGSKRNFSTFVFLRLLENWGRSNVLGKGVDEQVSFVVNIKVWMYILNRQKHTKTRSALTTRGINPFASFFFSGAFEACLLSLFAINNECH